MPRIARVVIPGLPHHITQRGNRRQDTFFSNVDYRMYLRFMARWCEEQKVEIWCYCLMPNHFHLVLWPLGDGDLSRWMHWLMTTHVQRHRCRYDTTGRIWQGRFKAPPIQQDRHLLTVIRYN